jgi:hypothetical protein
MSNVENIVEIVETLEHSKVKKRGRPKAKELVIDTALPIPDVPLPKPRVNKKVQIKPEVVLEENVVESPPKVKRVQSEKQKMNFIKCLEARKASLELKRSLKAQQAQ